MEHPWKTKAKKPDSFLAKAKKHIPQGSVLVGLFIVSDSPKFLEEASLTLIPLAYLKIANGFLWYMTHSSNKGTIYNK